MSYEIHNEDQCDKCGKKVGKKNLKPVNFLYLDKNDKKHPDMSWRLGPGTEPGYRQYYICEQCKKEGV